MHVLYSFTQDRRTNRRDRDESERHPIKLTPAMTVGLGILAMVLISAAYLLG